MARVDLAWIEAGLLDSPGVAFVAILVLLLTLLLQGTDEQLIALGSMRIHFVTKIEIAAYQIGLATFSPLAKKLAVLFLQQVGNLGLLFVQFLLTAVIAAILYANGETAPEGVEAFVRRLIGPQGVDAIHLAGQTIRGVAQDIVVTAIVQGAGAEIGLKVAGVPFPMLLTAVMFVLAHANCAVAG